MGFFFFFWREITGFLSFWQRRSKDVSSDVFSYVDICPCWATQIILQSPLNSCQIVKNIACFEHKLDFLLLLFFYVLPVIIRLKVLFIYFYQEFFFFFFTLEIPWFPVPYIHNDNLGYTCSEDKTSILPWFGQDDT